MAILFDDYDDYIPFVPGIDDMLRDFTTGWSFQVWVWPSVTNDQGYIFDARTANDIREIYLYFDDGNNRFQFTYYDGSTYYTSWATNFVGQVWHHVVCTCDGSWLRIYVNSVLKSSIDISGANIPGGTDLAGPSLGERYLNGGHRPGGNQFYYGGKITEFAFWDKPLVQDDVDTLFIKRKGQPALVQAGNLQSYLPMDDGVIGTSANGDVLVDLSGEGNTGTGNDGANNTGLTWSDESDIWAIPMPKVNAGLVNTGLTGGLTG